jgi:hypothetical protein
MPINTITPYWNNGLNNVAGTTQVANGTTGLNWDNALAPVIAGAAAAQANIAFNFANLQDLFIVANGGNVSMRTNSNTSPAQNFTFPAGGGTFQWNANSPMPNPFNANVTDIFFYIPAGSGNSTITLNGATN